MTGSRGADDGFGWGAPAPGPGERAAKVTRTAATPPPPREAPHPRDVARSSTADVAEPRRRVDARERERRRRRSRFLALAAAATVLLAAGAAVFGAVWNPWRPPEPPLEPAPVTAGPAAPGAVSGGRLAAGQCFASYASAWQDEYELADCAAPHAAELYAVVSAVEFAADPVYPGDAALRSEAMRACQSPSAVNAQVAAGIPDLRIEAAYALSQAEWDAGVRSYWCFASRESGGPLESTLTLA